MKKQYFIKSLYTLALLMFFIGHSTVVFSASEPVQTLVQAVTANDMAGIKKLIAENVKIDELDEQGFSALHHAAASGKGEIIKELISHKASLEIRSYSNSTPLMVATWNGHRESVEILLENGAQIDATDSFGLTALHQAVLRRNLAVVVVLLDHCANTQIMASDNLYPLDIALKIGDSAIIGVLLKAGAKPSNLRSIASTFLKIALGVGVYYLIFKNTAVSLQEEKVTSTCKVDDIVGIDDKIRQEAREIVYYMQNPKACTDIGASISPGVILTGQGDAEKTALVRAIARESGAKLYERSGSEFMGIFVNSGVANLNLLLKTAQKNAPSIILIHNVEEVLKRRSGNESPSQQIINEHNKMTNTLLRFLHELGQNSRVLIIGSTDQSLEGIDPEATRSGRFGRIINFPLLNEEARVKLLKACLNKKPAVEEDLNGSLEEIAKKTQGFSSAELQTMVNDAALIACRKNAKKINKDHLNQACDQAIKIGVKALSGKCFRKIEREATSIKLGDMAGIDNLKEIIRNVLDSIHNSNRYVQMGADMPRGILMVGPPGTGKTMMAKALANECGCNFYESSGSEFVSKWVGQAAEKLREFFMEVQRSTEPSIIFIDEIDSIAMKRGGESEREYSTTTNQLLTLLDGFAEKNKNIIVIGATNQREKIDPALTRPKRLGLILEFVLPQEEARKDILRTYINKKPCVDEGCKSSQFIDDLAKNTNGFNSAELADLVNEAACAAARDSSAEKIEVSHLEKAYQEAIKRHSLVAVGHV